MTCEIIAIILYLARTAFATNVICGGVIPPVNIVESSGAFSVDLSKDGSGPIAWLRVTSNTETFELNIEGVDTVFYNAYAVLDGEKLSLPACFKKHQAKANTYEVTVYVSWRAMLSGFHAMTIISTIKE